MTTPRQFTPLLKHLLGFYRSGPLPVPLLFWLLACGIVLYCNADQTPVGWMEGHQSSSALQDMQLASAGALWLFIMLISTPLPILVLGGATSLEFIFTRAVDRTVWLRAGRAAILVLVVAPLLANLACSPWAPPLAFNPAMPGSAAAATQERYKSAFPGSHVQPVGKDQDSQLVVNHGTEWFAAWLVWLALAAIALVSLYFSWAYLAWQRAGWHHSKSPWRPWLGGLMIYAPAFSVVVLFLGSTALRINLYEESFLFFALHPVPLLFALAVSIALIQAYSERTFQELEFEFF